MVTDNWSRTIAIPIIIHLYQKIIGLANALEYNFQASETPHIVGEVEQSFNHALTCSDFATQTLPHTDVYESPLPSAPAALGQPAPTALDLWDQYSSHLGLPQLPVPQSPLPLLPDDFDDLEPNELAFWDQYGPQLDLLGQTSTSQSAPNILPGSTSHKRTSETYSKAEAPTSKRVKNQVSLGQHPLVPLNYFPFNDEFTINAHSQPFGAPLTASTDPKYPMDQFRHVSELARPMLFPTFLDHELGFYQTGTHQPNNMKQNDDNHLDDLMRTPHRQIKKIDDKSNHETARALSNRASENQESSERVKCKSSDPTALRHAPAALTKTRDQPFLVYCGIKHRWVDFKPSTIHGKLVIQVMQNFRFRDGTNFFHQSMSPNHEQVLEDTIQNQFSQKMFCLESSTTNIVNSFKTLYEWVAKRPTKSEKESVIARARSRFVVRYGDPKLDSTPQTDIEEYKMTVLSEFRKSRETCWNTVLQHLDDKNFIKKTAKIFGTEMKHFPMYLLYVDLISALLPVDHLDVEGNLLKRQREIAAKGFFNLIQEALLDDKQGDWKYNRSDKESTLIGQVKKMQSGVKFGGHDLFFSFVWKALEYWIANSREDLQQVVKRACFKRFINKLVQSWAAKA